MKDIDTTLFDRHPLAVDFFDDFHKYSTTRWLFTDTPTGIGNNTAALVTDGTASAVKITNEDSQDAEGTLSSKTSFDITSTRPLVFECRLLSAATQQAIFAGHHSVGSTVFTSASAIAGTWSGFGFYKLAGETAWTFASHVSTTSYGSNTCEFSYSSSVYQSFRVTVVPVSSTIALVTPMIDVLGGTDYKQLVDSTSGLPVQHELTYTSYATAFVTFATAQGSGANTTLAIDSARTRQRR